ncbi:carbohydrate porin [Cupriavidus gilardii]|uniref:carbohydrate porin n=1 Tax=Cupriavidus gilardii TaxID=82541 RepID=UPI0021DB5907
MSLSASSSSRRRPLNRSVRSSVLPRPRWLYLAGLAAWGIVACAQTPPAPEPIAPPVFAPAAPVPAVARLSSWTPDSRPNPTQNPMQNPTQNPSVEGPVPPAESAGSQPQPQPQPQAADADPLAGLLQREAPAAADAATGTLDLPPADTPEQTALAELDPGLAGPPEPLPPAPPPVVLFPNRLGEFMPEAMAPAGGDAAATPSDAPPVFASNLPSAEPAEETVWSLSYSGRAAYEDNTHAMRACPGGSLSTGIGHGVACQSSGEVKLREQLYTLDGGGAIEVVAQARGTNTTTIDGRPAPVDPYQLIPQFYTAVKGVAALDGATMWAGRRDTSPFLMSSGLLPPTSSALRFGVDDARIAGVGLSYQYTARNDTNGQHLPSYHSVRTAPIGVNDKGTLQLGFTRVQADALADAAGDAWWASAMHEQKGVLAGTNRFGLQYGAGSRTAMTGYTGMGDTLSRVRVAESMEWKGRAGLIGSVESSLQYDRSALGTLQWMTTRVRPAYAPTERFRLSFEVAHDQISSGFGVSGQRTALTVAPTLTLGKAAGNANLRAFYTYSRANDVDGITFAAPADAWASQATGSIFGIQLNRRW